MKRKHWTMIVPGAVLLCATPAFAVDLREAVQAALGTNPEIRQAVHNKIATKEERKQARLEHYELFHVLFMHCIEKRFNHFLCRSQRCRFVPDPF